jgi:hypothetical protein
MAVDRSHGKKSPSQNPIDFYMLKQAGGAYGMPTKVPDTFNTKTADREKLMGRPNLSTTMTGNSVKSK